MSEKAVYYKDNGEPCKLCQKQSGFCHIHSNAAESDDSGFSVADNPNHCPECENPIRVHSTTLETQRHNPNRVNVSLVLCCSCEEAEIPNGVHAVEADYIPDKWL